MADITFEELLRAVQKLTPEQRAQLVRTLNMPPLDMGPTREELIAETEALRAAGALQGVAPLRNKYADPSRPELTDPQLRADIRDAATGWTKELDEYFGDDH
jgi:hypothetical protein